MQLFQIKKTDKNLLWTKDEDEILISNTKVNGKNRWKEISKLIKGKSAYHCYLRFRAIHPDLKKGSWSREEDERIMLGVEQYGRGWSLIAKYLFTNRNAKQIRDRYTNYLDPDIKKGRFCLAEDLLILDLFTTYGPKWSLIQKHLKYRSTDAIKNRYNSSIKRNKQLYYIKLLDENKVRFLLILEYF
jgi:hypothetical protein